MNKTDNTAGIIPYRIGILLIDGFALLSYASVVEPLRAANLLGNRELFRISNVSVSGNSSCSSSGALVPTVPLEPAPEMDLLLVVAGGDPLGFDSDDVLAWLRKLDRSGVTIGGISGGPAILALAGLMTGRRMTVHWEHAPALRELMPELALEQALYLIDRNRVTCAGGTAPLDLMHGLIAGHHGHGFAQQVSDWFMHTEVRHWQRPQRAGLVERHGTTNRAVLNALEAMETHVAEPLSLRQLAKVAEIGTRQLNRLFVAELGVPTMHLYRRLRLEVAARMLAGSSLPITDIALATGFADSSHFSRAFSAESGMAPSSFRRNAFWRTGRIGQDQVAAVPGSQLSRRAVSGDPVRGNTARGRDLARHPA